MPRTRHNFANQNIFEKKKIEIDIYGLNTKLIRNAKNILFYSILFAFENY